MSRQEEFENHSRDRQECVKRRNIVTVTLILVSIDLSVKCICVCEVFVIFERDVLSFFRDRDFLVNE